MALLLKYALETGTVVGLWESNNLTVLAAQQVEGDPVYGYLVSTLDLPASTVQQDYLVVDGALVPRPGR